MKVILLKDVAKIGRHHDVVTVPDGFALNKLIPKGLAQAATGENLKRLKNVSEKVAKDQESEQTHFAEALDKLKETSIIITVDANNEGRMFQSLKADAIAAAVKDAVGYELGVEQIILKTPIKSVGEHEIVLASGVARGTLIVNLKAK